MTINSQVVERARLRHGLLRSELADQAKVHLNTVDNICTKNVASMVALRKIVSVLGLTVADVLVEEKEEPAGHAA